MKPVIKFAAYILLTSSIFFVACKKEKPVSSVVTPPPPPDTTLSGKEFIFNDLIWTVDVNSVICASVDNRPDLFLKNIGRPIEVSIRLNALAAWILVPAWSSPTPSHNGFLYNWALPRIPNPYNPYFYFFQVLPEPYNFQLEGTRVSIRVKFL